MEDQIVQYKQKIEKANQRVKEYLWVKEYF